MAPTSPIAGYFDLTRKNSQKNPIKKIPTVAASHFNGLAREIGSQPTDPVCDERDAIERPTTTTTTIRIAAASTASNPAMVHLR
jgi:hypothetical protein